MILLAILFLRFDVDMPASMVFGTLWEVRVVIPSIGQDS